MDKERFLLLTRNYTTLTSEEASELTELLKDFPYSQVVHHLATRGARDNGLPQAENLLHMSAVYSTDRALLKELVTAPRGERREPPAVYPEPVAAEMATVPVSHPPLEVVPINADHEHLSEILNHEIMADLSRLQQLKHNFEITVEAMDKGVPLPELTAAKPRETRKAKPQSSVKVDAPTASARKKTDHDGLRPEPSGDLLLNEITSSKKTITPENPRQKEQIEIIDQFIKKQPSIPKGTAPSVDNPDLAESSVTLTDNIVSETLVEILLKQGKKDKAIEVLKKLIWKFPQKKSIFAAQIEELKK